MNADAKNRKSRVAALGLVIELIAIYRMTKIFRELRARRKKAEEPGGALQRPVKEADR